MKNPNYIQLDQVVISKLHEYGIVGKKVAQICCNNGIETISLKKLGAELCVGFDISDEAIKEAINLSESVNIPVEYVRTDIYEIPKEYYSQFDYVYISGGFESFGIRWRTFTIKLYVNWNEFWEVVTRIILVGRLDHPMNKVAY